MEEIDTKSAAWALLGERVCKVTVAAGCLALAGLFGLRLLASRQLIWAASAGFCASSGTYFLATLPGWGRTRYAFSALSIALSLVELLLFAVHREAAFAGASVYCGIIAAVLAACGAAAPQTVRP